MLDNQSRFKKVGIIVSFVVGLPIGLTIIAITRIAPAAISGEGLANFILLGVYGKGLIGMLVSFLFALWYAGKRIPADLATDFSLLRVSYLYSLRVNTIIWTVFLVITLFQNLSFLSFFILFVPMIAFAVCVCLSTITIGLLIGWIVQVLIKKISESPIH